MAEAKHFKRSSGADTQPAAALTESSEVRRQRNTLYISGMAVIGFLLWDILKAFVLDALKEPATPAPETTEAEVQTLQGVLRNAGLPEVNETTAQFYLLLLVGFLLFFIVDIFVRIYVGRAAIAQARGERRSVLYVILACMTLVAVTLNTVVTLWIIVTFGADSNAVVASIIDLTSIAMLFDLIRSAIALRRVERRARRQGV